MPNKLVCPVAPKMLAVLVHAPAVPNPEEPTLKAKPISIPTELLVNHVPVVSPAIVTVLYSHVFAEEIL